MKLPKYDITDFICENDLDQVISLLMKLKEQGYNSFFFDGYDAALYVIYETPAL